MIVENKKPNDKLDEIRVEVGDDKTSDKNIFDEVYNTGLNDKKNGEDKI